MELGCTTIEKSIIPEMEGGRKGEVMREEGDTMAVAVAWRRKHDVR